ncbi:MAG: hypothetical protein OWU84_05010 [Firmicutes bacterium]|nr:hypothetical protein [Bacillota bacterium]
MGRIPVPYLALTAVLGILAFLNLVWLRHDAISTPIAVIIYLLVLVLAYFGGRSARRHALRPGWFGAAMGALFGIIASLGSLLIRETLRDIDVPGRRLLRLKLLAWANSPSGHLASIMTAMITFGLLSLILASIGGSTLKDPKQS